MSPLEFLRVVRLDVTYITDLSSDTFSHSSDVVVVTSSPVNPRRPPSVSVAAARLRVPLLPAPSGPFWQLDRPDTQVEDVPHPRTV